MEFLLINVYCKLMFDATSHNINHGKDKKIKSIYSEMAKKSDGKKSRK